MLEGERREEGGGRGERETHYDVMMEIGRADENKKCHSLHWNDC